MFYTKKQVDKKLEIQREDYVRRMEHEEYQRQRMEIKLDTLRSVVERMGNVGQEARHYR